MTRTIATLCFCTLTNFACSRKTLTSEEIRTALRPLKSLKVEAGQKQIIISLTIPATDAWKRIIRLWGSPRYVVAALPNENDQLLCLGHSNEIRVNRYGGKPLRLTTPDYVLYGYSSECVNYGVEFSARPGDIVNIVIASTLVWKTTPAEVFIAADWGPNVKDRIVTTDLRGR